MSEIYDLAVIGAGPGGVLAAKICAGNGFKMIVLKEDCNVGEPIH